MYNTLNTAPQIYYMNSEQTWGQIHSISKST